MKILLSFVLFSMTVPIYAQTVGYGSSIYNKSLNPTATTSTAISSFGGAKVSQTFNKNTTLILSELIKQTPTWGYYSNIPGASKRTGTLRCGIENMKTYVVLATEDLKKTPCYVKDNGSSMPTARQMTIEGQWYVPPVIITALISNISTQALVDTSTKYQVQQNYSLEKATGPIQGVAIPNKAITIGQ